MISRPEFSFPMALLILFFSSTISTGAPTEIQSMIDKVLPNFDKYSTDPIVVNAVKKANDNSSELVRSMTNEKWKNLSILSPEVKSFAKNDLAKYFKSSKPAYVEELFVSTADGSKVAFFSKPSNWTHKGKPKHDLPMQGKRWIGEVEVDASSGIEQIQFAIPVLDGKKPIGSIVFGLSILELQKDNASEKK